MDRRATQQCNLFPNDYAVYWLPPASSAFLLARKCNGLAERMLITCVMRHAWTHKFQMSGPTVHSYTVTIAFSTTQKIQTEVLFMPSR